MGLLVLGSVMCEVAVLNRALDVFSHFALEVCRLLSDQYCVLQDCALKGPRSSTLTPFWWSDLKPWTPTLHQNSRLESPPLNPTNTRPCVFPEVLINAAAKAKDLDLIGGRFPLQQWIVLTPAATHCTCLECPIPLDFGCFRIGA